MSLVLICSLALSCVNVKAEDYQIFEIWPVNEDGERLYYADITIKDTENNQNNLVAVPYQSFYKDYSGDIYAKFSKQIINGKQYKKKDIRIRKESCYDGACFWGEIKGDNFISYEKLSKAVGLPYDKEHIPAMENKYLELGNEYAIKADKLDKEEKAVGGMWLKFTDNKYEDKNGNVREFYIAKKPVLKGISWDDLYNANVVYGLDHQEYEYKHKIIRINGKKYVVRLLRGFSNYNNNGIFFEDSLYKRGRNCHYSEWNRTMIPITKQNRYYGDMFSGAALEDKLKISNSGDDNYKISTANYDWLGDLTLGPNDVKYYDGIKVVITGLYGQQNWMQEYNQSKWAAIRGFGESNPNAAYSSLPFKNSTHKTYGWRPVLELIKE